jgi:hypothetical protein
MAFRELPEWLLVMAIALPVSSSAFVFLFGGGVSFGLSLLYSIGPVVAVLALLKWGGWIPYWIRHWRKRG